MNIDMSLTDIWKSIQDSSYNSGQQAQNYAGLQQGCQGAQHQTVGIQASDMWATAQDGPYTYTWDAVYPNTTITYPHTSYPVPAITVTGPAIDPADLERVKEEKAREYEKMKELEKMILGGTETPEESAKRNEEMRLAIASIMAEIARKNASSAGLAEEDAGSKEKANAKKTNYWGYAL